MSPPISETRRFEVIDLLLFIYLSQLCNVNTNRYYFEIAVQKKS